jgi:hypothetical protein
VWANVAGGGGPASTHPPYSISGIDPAVGDAGVVVRITGPYPFTAATEVDFGGTKASYWWVNTDGSITAYAPALPPGTSAPVSVAINDFVVMLVKALQLPPGGGPTAFSDVAPSDPLAPYLVAAEKAGLFGATLPKQFGSLIPVSGQEMAALVQRGFGAKAPLQFVSAPRLTRAQAATELFSVLSIHP